MFSLSKGFYRPLVQKLSTLSPFSTSRYTFATTTIPLTRNLFNSNEDYLLTISPNEDSNENTNHTIISTFKYSTGVEALKVLISGKLLMILLPFQGHQIWSLAYYRNINNICDYYPISMQTMFKEPNKIDCNETWDYLKTYGGFYIHCGILAMGAPGENDDHPLHGELPNGNFENSWIEYDDTNKKLKLYGSFLNQKQFDYNYTFTSCHEISLADIDNTNDINNLITTKSIIDNNYHNPLNVMYLAHINFKPELNGRLYNTSNNVNIRDIIPAHIKPSKEYLEFLPKLVKDPSIHTYLDNNMMNLLGTEVVMTYKDFKSIKIPNLRDCNDSWSVSMQLLDDTNDSYVTLHNNNDFPYSIRWLVKDSGISALGLSLPSTSQPNGKTLAIQNNEYKTIEGFNSLEFNIKYGYLNSNDSLLLKDKICDEMNIKPEKEEKQL